ncbi:hypothetical protein LCGC14_2090900, partial [marine sediment metagenome]
MNEFIHLHNHSDFSLLDGAISIDGLIDKAVALQMPALALTDHGNMFGIPEFYKACLSRGVKPIIGSEFYLAPESRLHKSGTQKDTQHFRLVLLAKDETGYRNLLKLSSIGYTEGFHYKPRIDDEVLKMHHQGIIALTACIEGEIPRLILTGQEERALEKALYYRDLFGKDGFYLELQNQGISDQKIVSKKMINIARQAGIPLVATNNVHYPNREDAIAQEILICVRTKKKFSEEKRLKFEYPEFYFKSQEEMAELFADIPEALTNTRVIADRCNVEIPFPGPQLPIFEVPVGFDSNSYLSKLAHQGLHNRYYPVTEQLKQRLEYELSVIRTTGYAGYFLLVWDIVKFAHEAGIPVG